MLGRFQSRVDTDAEERRKTNDRQVARHVEVGWFEWTMREFLRYVYLLGLLALVVMGPLQMALAWLPYNGPAVMDPPIVGALAIAFVCAVLYLGQEGYRFLWRQGGWVDRIVARQQGRAGPQGEDSRNGG